MADFFEDDFLYSPPIPPRPLSTPAGVERGSLVPILLLDSGSRITTWRSRPLLVAPNFNRVGRSKWLCVCSRARSRARRAASRAAATTLRFTTTGRFEIWANKIKSRPFARNSVFEARGQIGIQPPLSAPAGVDRGRGGIGGEKKQRPARACTKATRRQAQ